MEHIWNPLLSTLSLSIFFSIDKLYIFIIIYQFFDRAAAINSVGSLCW